MLSLTTRNNQRVDILGSRFELIFDSVSTNENDKPLEVIDKPSNAGRDILCLTFSGGKEVDGFIHQPLVGHTALDQP